MDAFASVASRRILAGLLLAAALHAQQPEPTAAAGCGDLREPRSWMPLEQGSEWVWRSTWMGDDGIERNLEWRCVLGAEVPLRRKEGAATARILRHSSTGTRRVTYWAAAPAGLTEYESTLDRSGPRFDTAVNWLPAPVGATTQWEWQYESPFQTVDTIAKVRGPMVKCRGELLSLDEAVKVPAGEFRCVHVRVTSMTEYSTAPIVHDRWFARGVGIVKETNSQIGDRVLLSFHHGPAVPDAGLLVEQWLRANELAAATTVRWIDLGDVASAMRGRFACVQPAASPTARLLHVDTAITELHGDDLAFWQTRSDEAAWPAAPGEQDGVACDLLAFCEVVARVAAEQRGWRSSSGSRGTLGTVTQAEQLEGCSADVQGTAADGTKWAMRCTAERRGGKLTKLHVEAVGGPQ